MTAICPVYLKYFLFNTQTCDLHFCHLAFRHYITKSYQSVIHSGPICNHRVCGILLT